MAKVLVVDDEKEVADLVCVRLAKSGYKPVAAYDGVSGLEAARNGKPDLILLDIIMPGNDGIWLLQKLRSDPLTEKVPVIMVTAKGHLTQIEQAQLLGATDYFIKPFVWEELLRFIRRYLP